MLGHLSADGHLLMQLHWKVQMPSEDPNAAESSGTKAGATVSSPTAVLVSSGGDSWLHGVGGRGWGGGELFVFGLTGAVSREIHSLSRRQAKSLCKAAGRL